MDQDFQAFSTFHSEGVAGVEDFEQRARAGSHDFEGFQRRDHGETVAQHLLGKHRVGHFGDGYQVPRAGRVQGYFGFFTEHFRRILSPGVAREQAQGHPGGLGRLSVGIGSHRACSPCSSTSVVRSFSATSS